MSSPYHHDGHGAPSLSTSRSMKSAHTHSSLNTNRTTNSRFYKHNLQVDSEVSAIIDEKVPHYFDDKARHHQVSMVHGRHPQSLPKDSELWMYNKLSAERRTRIKKGHAFWTVIEETNVNKRAHSMLETHRPRGGHARLHSETVSPIISGKNEKEKAKEKEKGKGKEEDNHALKGSIKKQLNSLNNSMENLDIKVDFVHQNQINFGMTFMIMNYANEVLYVDKNNALRTKPITAVQPYDRVKFKMVDLVNPSNPSALEFGDNMWIQCLELADNADNSFSAGSVITTKLFEPPELASVRFEESYSSSAQRRPLLSRAASVSGTARQRKEEIEQQFMNLEKEKEESLAQLQKERRDKKERHLRRSQDMSEQLHRLAKRFPSHAKSMMILDEDKEDVGRALHQLIDEEEELRRTFDEQSAREMEDRDGLAVDAMREEDEENSDYDNESLDSTKNMKTSTSFDHSEVYKSFHRKEKGHRERLAREAKQRAAHESAQRDHHGVDNTKIAEICGHVDLNRIVEIRKSDSLIPDNSNMSDEKASRFNSKTALNLGKWTIHSAVRPDLRLESRETTGKVRHTALSAAAAVERENHLHPGFLYSLTPIIIQQDQYCLSTAHPDEFHQWPPNSTYIIHNSKLISSELAAEYEKNFAKVSPAVSDTNGAFMKTSSTADGFGESSMTDAHEEKEKHAEEGMSSPSHHHVSFAANVSFSPPPPPNRDDYGCLRKIVPRGPPYDFAVDRRCVWKICLFEQFSENYMQLSTKEKQATKLMETATMALKLSKINREGGRLHLPSNPAENLPPLVGGEKFSRTLREITLRTTQKAQNQQFRDRRLREVKVKEYFLHRAHHHVQNLDPEESTSANSPMLSESSTMSEGFGVDGDSSFLTQSASSSPWLPASSAPLSRPGRDTGDHHDDNSSLGSNFSSVSRRRQPHLNASLSSVDGLGSLSINHVNKAHQLPALSINNEDSMISRSMSHDSMSFTQHTPLQMSATPKQHLSEDILRVFHPKDYRRDRSLMVLNNTKAVRNFKALSDGEQILSLHKTMNHLKNVAEQKVLSTVQVNTFSKPKPTNANVLKKIEMLQAESQIVDQILNVKEMIKKRREVVDLDEDEY